MRSVSSRGEIHQGPQLWRQWGGVGGSRPGKAPPISRCQENSEKQQGLRPQSCPHRLQNKHLRTSVSSPIKWWGATATLPSSRSLPWLRIDGFVAEQSTTRERGKRLNISKTPSLHIHTPLRGSILHPHLRERFSRRPWGTSRGSGSAKGALLFQSFPKRRSPPRHAAVPGEVDR